MKPRNNRVISEQVIPGRTKSEASTNGPTVQRNPAQLNAQQANVQAIRKRRSSINVYDQPSSLNSRLRQLETDMLRLDEDRTKLFDDTHTSLAQYELKLNEIHAILKSRQDNVEKYVEDMKLLLQAKEEFEKQTKLLNEKHDRIQEKFMHRETTISREIKLLKNKFELLERNRQFKNILQKSNSGNLISKENNEDLANSVDSSENLRRKSEAISEVESLQDKRRASGLGQSKSVQIQLPKLNSVRNMLGSILGLRRPGKMRRKNNRVSSLTVQPEDDESGEKTDKTEADGPMAIATTTTASFSEIPETRKKRRNKGGLFGRFFRQK